MEQKWEEFKRALQQKLSPEVYNTWVPNMHPDRMEGKMLYIGVPSQVFVQAMHQQIQKEFVAAFLEVYGRDIQLNWSLIKDENPNKNAGRAGSSAIAPGSSNETYNPQRTTSQAAFDSQLNPAYSFDNYCEGLSNKAILSVARSIAEGEKLYSTFTPFFLHGASGVGKTHLVNAIGLEMQRRNPNLRVLLISATLFRDQYGAAAQQKRTNDFFYFYQSIDVLIIDDIQLIITSSGKTLESFFHIFNHLHNLGKKILITSDRPPVELVDFADRMLTRLKWGIVLELERPDIGLRRKILEAKLRSLDFTIPEEVLDFIAENVTDNVRELQGTLNSMIAFSIGDGGDITLDLARRTVPRLVNQAYKDLSVQQILNHVCRHYKVKSSEIVGKSRKKEITAVRQLAIFLIKKYTPLSYTQIGRELGKRDHTTILHSFNKIEKQVCLDKVFRREVEELEASLKAPQRS